MGEQTKNTKLMDNAMLKINPSLIEVWNFKRNGEMGLSVYEVSNKSSRWAWWNCPTCESEYDMRISDRTKSCPKRCPYCSGKRVNNTNSLSVIMPMIAKEWHPTKNKELTPDKVVCGSNKKVWWLGECGHEWDAVIADRALNNNNCPYCANQRVLAGYNDMWTTNPTLASQLNDFEDGYKYTQFSSKKTDWRCADCGNIIRNRIICNINRQGLSCSLCSDGMPYGEKFMYHLLKEYDLDFEYDVSRSWSKGKRYDFYLPEQNCIIEVHGMQHYKSTFENLGGVNNRTLEEEKINDANKKTLAIANGVDMYVEIDARYSDGDYIKEKVLNSDMSEIISKVDFEKVARLTNNSLVRDACDLWNAGFRSTSVISEKLKIHIGTAQVYLERGASAGWCDYCSIESKQRSLAIGRASKRIPVVQLDLDNNFIKVWESAKKAIQELGIANTIHKVCKGNQKTTGGFRWMYEEDYNKTKYQNKKSDLLN